MTKLETSNIRTDSSAIRTDFAPFDKYSEFITKTIGIEVNMARCKYNLSVRNFAKDIGVSSTVVSDLENGTKIPRMETILRILWALNIPFEHIFAERILPPKVFKDNNKQYLQIHKFLTEEGLSK